MLKREFSLILQRMKGRNLETKSFDLNSKTAFAQNPNGLGANSEFDMLKVGNRNTINQQKYNFSQIQLEIAFNSYDSFKSFFEILSWGDYKAKLVYKIPLNNQLETFTRDVVINSVPKSEKIKGYLASTIIMTPLSFWYKDTTNTINLVAEETEYISIPEGKSELARTLIFNVSNKGSKFEVSYSGNYSESKYFELKNLDSSDLSNLNRLYYSSEDGDAYINVQNSYGTIKKDLLNSTYFDVQNSNTPFIQIPAYDFGWLRFTSDVAATVIYTIREYYIAV